MTQHQDFKATVRSRRDFRECIYSQAWREITEQLATIAEFDRLPVVWECAYRRRPFSRPSREAHQRALGAVELAIRESSALDGAERRDCWRTGDGHIDLDWCGGPFAFEVVRELLAVAEEEETSTLDPGDLLPGVDLVGNLNAVWLNDVRVRFRPDQPIGAVMARAQMWAKYSARHAGERVSDHGASA